MSNGRSARRKLARRDGETIRVRSCCQLVITLGTARIKVAHDNGCPALAPSTPAGLAARLQANHAVSAALTARGLRPLVVMA